MLRAVCIAVAALIASPTLAQTTEPKAAPPESLSAPIVGGPPPAIVGLSPCENLIGLERDNCLKEERAPRMDGTGGRSAGAGGTHAPGSTGTGHGSAGAQNTAPSGSTR